MWNPLDEEVLPAACSDRDAQPLNRRRWRGCAGSPLASSQEREAGRKERVPWTLSWKIGVDFLPAVVRSPGHVLPLPPGCGERADPTARLLGFSTR